MIVGIHLLIGFAIGIALMLMLAINSHGDVRGFIRFLRGSE